MRIIAGNFKGRKIFDPINSSTRPLKDRVRESVFNIIEHSNEISLNNSSILDLYSGVGSFGLECLSRGAKEVYFFENYKPALNILKKNIEALDCKKNSKIIEQDVERISNFQKIFINKIDLVFFDPPYIYEKINTILNKIYKMKILSKKASIIIHRNNSNKDNFIDKLKQTRIKAYGKSKIIFGKLVN